MVSTIAERNHYNRVLKTIPSELANVSRSNRYSQNPPVQERELTLHPESVKVAPKYEANGQIGYIKGTRSDPVSLSTIETIKRNVLHHRPDPDRLVATPTPDTINKNIIGFGISVREGFPKTMIKYTSDTNSGGSNYLTPIEKKAHNNIDDFVNVEK